MYYHDYLSPSYLNPLLSVVALSEAKAAQARIDTQTRISELQRAVTAMELLESAMQEAESIMQPEADNHLENFKEQMRKLAGIRAFEPAEPNIDLPLAEGALDYISRLNRHVEALQAFVETGVLELEQLNENERADRPAGTNGAAKQLVAIPLELKMLDLSEEVEPQIEATIDIERERSTRRANQLLDRERQQANGFTHYMWVTAGDDKVRPSHDDNDGEIFSWDEAPAETGHPGEDFNCRCSAVPVLEGFTPPDDSQLLDNESTELTEPGLISTPVIETIIAAGAITAVLVAAPAIVPAAAAVAATTAARVAGARILAAAGQGIAASGQALNRLNGLVQRALRPTTRPIPRNRATSHARERNVLRNISERDVNSAIRSAERSGRVEIKTGRYGTKQRHYKGDNGVTVIVETEGRNAGKVITVWKNN